jgi:hypothetical protein
MTTGSEVQTKDDVLPDLVGCLDRVAMDSSVSAFNRLEAIEILLRLAIGPRSRSADSTDVAASRSARIALLDTAPFLHEVMESNNRARIRLHAASLARFVGELSGCADGGSHEQRLG